MKTKLIISAIGVFAVLSFASCKKVRSCYCKNYLTGQQLEVDTKGKVSKKDAIKYCESGNAYIAQGFQCELE